MVTFIIYYFQWGLVCKYEWIADFTTLLQMLGIGFGSPIFGPIADWYDT
jgi:hypothetical protein